MLIRIEVDVKPEELRRFIGLPDIAGLQEDAINFMREKGAAGFDVAGNVVKGSFDVWRKWVNAAFGPLEQNDAPAAETTTTAAKPKKPRAKKTTP